MGNFEIDLRRFGAKTEQRMNQTVRKICLDLFTLIVRRSPVDTGRFRANNQIDLNTVSGASIVTFHTTKSGTRVRFGGGGIGGGANTISREFAKLGSYKLGDTVFIYNNVEYALDLEYGSSKQAPAGVYRISVQDLLNFLVPGAL